MDLSNQRTPEQLKTLWQLQYIDKREFAFLNLTSLQHANNLPAGVRHITALAENVPNEL